MVAQSDRGGRVVAIEDAKPSGRTQYAKGLRKGTRGLGYVRKG